MKYNKVEFAERLFEAKRILNDLLLSQSRNDNFPTEEELKDLADTKSLVAKAELLINPKFTKVTEPQLNKTACSTSLPSLVPCPKEQYILEYFGLSTFDENQRLVVDMGILADLMYGFEQKMEQAMT